VNDDLVIGRGSDDNVTPAWRWILLAWAVPATIGAVQLSITIRARNGTGWLFVALEVARWMSWALITPAIFALARRVPVTRERLWSSLAIHFLAAVAVALLIESTWFLISLPFRVTTETPPPRTGPVIRLGLTMIGDYWKAYIAPGSPLSGIGRRLFVPVVLGRIATNGITYAAVVAVASTLRYQRRLRERDTRAARLEAELASAQVQALKMQLHPHFIFNTLHAVNVLIRENPTAATRVVTQLGDLLRLTLARAERAEVPLASELELLKLYLEIERTRFRDRLTIEYDIDPTTLQALVPDLILQPLAENAIRHGVSQTGGAASIYVRSRRDESWLVLEVADNGRGLPASRPDREGVGLGSTRRRLAAMYGSDQELSVGPLASDGTGCVARLRIRASSA
jgi:two-component system, LytTR family, sensor kinase